MVKRKSWIEKNQVLVVGLVLIAFLFYGFSSGLIDLTPQSVTNVTNNTTNPVITAPVSTAPQPVDEPVVDENVPNLDWFNFIPFNNPCDDYATAIGKVWYPNNFNAAGGTIEDCDIVRGACRLYPPKGYTGNINELTCCSFDKQCYEPWELV